MKPGVIRPYQQEQAVSLIIDELNERVRQSVAAPVLVGISGIDASGKTTLAEAVRQRATEIGLQVELANVDEFIIPPDQRKSEGPPFIDYFEHTFDHAAFIQKVKGLAAVTGVQIVLAEGIFLFRKELVARWDVRIWLEMTAAQSLERGAERDIDMFGSLEKARSLYVDQFIPAHEYHMGRDRPSESADFVFTVD